MAYDPSSFDPLRPDRRGGKVLSAERLESLREILDLLPTELRRCFLLRHARGYDVDEIAVLMKLPVDRVRMCLRQACAMLGLGEEGEIS